MERGGVISESFPVILKTSMQLLYRYFRKSQTLVAKDNDASMQDIKLLLATEKGELFGDPFMGIRLKRYVFEQNNDILRDILIDEIYSQLLVFAPQITVRRKDIKITQDGKDIKISFRAINNVDFKTNMYDLVLYQGEER